MTWEYIVATVSHWIDAWDTRLQEVGILDWALFFAPVLFLEVPKYYVPMAGLWVLHALGLPRVDRRARAGFLRRAPMVSVVVAGRNEAGSIEACIRSLLEQTYPNLEIIVVDDHSEDETYAIARRYAREGLIRTVRNCSLGGRTGRPPASNLGLRVSNGDFIISLDADTTFDMGLIERMIEPFADPAVGVVAGNVLARNAEANIVTRLQTVEYFTSIDLQKRWTDFMGSTLQASGAIGAFRRSALMKIGGWDPELAEDGDLSMRLVKSGWRVAFAPEAVALTDLPDSWNVLLKQRYRWDRGALRTYFSKHGRLLRPSVAGFAYARGMWGELFFSTLLPLVHPIYLVWLLSQGLPVFVFVTIATWGIYFGLAWVPLVTIAVVSKRATGIRSLIAPGMLMPVYRAVLRWVKIRALLHELMRVRYKDGYLPDSAWQHAPRF